ncbi:MAG: ArsR family transcriptional regulator [Nitrososphaeria archaeon]|jgi:predicted transcriptional regulator
MSKDSIKQLFQIIGTYNRFKMLEMLCKEPLTMNELAKMLNISVPAVLKNLTALEGIEIVTSRNIEGTGGRPRKVYYLTQKVIPKIIIDDEIQAIEFYIVKPKPGKEEVVDKKDLELRKTVLKIKLKRLERKRLKIIKELERLDNVRR